MVQDSVLHDVDHHRKRALFPASDVAQLPRAPVDEVVSVDGRAHELGVGENGAVVGDVAILYWLLRRKETRLWFRGLFLVGIIIINFIYVFYFVFNIYKNIKYAKKYKRMKEEKK